MSGNASRNDAGQALLETLIAVAILAIALVALLAGLVQLQDRRLDAARTRHAGQLATDKLAAVELLGEAGIANASGEFPAPDNDFSWKVTVTATPDALFRVLAVEVRAKGSQDLSVTFSRLEPKP